MSLLFKFFFFLIYGNHPAGIPNYFVHIKLHIPLAKMILLNNNKPISHVVIN